MDHAGASSGSISDSAVIPIPWHISRHSQRVDTFLFFENRATICCCEYRILQQLAAQARLPRGFCPGPPPQAPCVAGLEGSCGHSATPATPLCCTYEWVGRRPSGGGVEEANATKHPALPAHHFSLSCQASVIRGDRCMMRYTEAVHAMASYPESDPRVQQLMEHGFWLPECQLALEAAGGDYEGAKAILTAAMDAEMDRKVARHINALLRKVRPWSEFFDRFLWPEHLNERVETNLVYYHANYVAVCIFLSVLWTAAQPGLFVRLLLSMSLGALAVAHREGALLGGEQLSSDAVMGGVSVVAVVLLMPHIFSLARLALLCAAVVFGHAAFRARSLPSRWSRFSKDVQKGVEGLTRDVKQKLQHLHSE